MAPRFDDKMIDDMRSLADSLLLYSYPSVSPGDEELVNYLKFRELDIDGYRIVLHLNKHNYGTHMLETFQIVGKDVPFLPFCLVAKLVKRMLGSHNLSLIEVFKDGRKIYCWTLMTNPSGQPIEAPFKREAEVLNFEGLRYCYVKPESVHFY